jgi:LPXTG-motif cell wall-anchored protein
VNLNRPVRIWLAAGALATTGASGFLPGHASAAACYPISSTCGTDGNSDGATVNDTTPVKGGTVMVVIAPGTFDPNTVVTVKLGTATIATFTSNSLGGGSFTVTIPTDTSTGVHTLTASGTKGSAAVTVSEVVTVQTAAGTTGSAGSTTSSSLPRTGSDILIPAAGLGVVMVSGGLLLKRGSKRTKA